MYHTPANNPDRAIAAARFMMLLLALALGIIIALFTYRLAGPLAACVAVTLFALDPNFLAHSSLVKNDVALAAAFTALTYFLYLLTQRLTLPRLLGCILCTAACFTIKLTGILAAPLIILILLTRALSSTPWPTSFSFIPQSAFRNPKSSRLLTALSFTLLLSLTTYLAIWAVYRFRFNPSPDPTVHFNTQAILDREAYSVSAARANAQHHLGFDRRELASWTPGPFVQLALFSLDHHLLPEPFIEGFLYAHASSIFRYSYCLGQSYGGSRWYYFPLAFLSKTPLTTLLIFFLSALLMLPELPTRYRQLATHPCTLAFLLLFFSIALSGINIGLRHILILYPFLFIAAGVAAARLYAVHPKLLRLALPLLLLTLSSETLSAYPDYIPFFNAAAGGYRGGFHLLGDSNLDWGQDLPLLAEWQRQNPTRTLHLAYFGLADPAHYHIHYYNLPNGYPFGPESPTTLPTTGVLAISATTLQGLYNPNPNDPTYAVLRNTTPTQILGGSIYLFDLDHPPH
jgi:hypothetical protein